MRIRLACLLFLGIGFPTLAQQVKEVRVQDLPSVQQTYGPDSLRSLLSGLPIWLVSEPVALALLRTMPTSIPPYSWERAYLRDVGLAVRSAAIAERLQRVLTKNIPSAQQLDDELLPVRALDEELLLALLYQAHPATETILDSCLQRYQAAHLVLKTKPKPNPIQYFFQGKGTIGENIEAVALSQYRLLEALHRLNPTRFPVAQVAAQRRRLPAHYRQYSLKPEPAIQGCYKRQRLPFEPLMRQGVSLPKQCSDSGCSVLKLVQSEQVYLVAEICRAAHPSGAGGSRTYLVTHQGADVEICFLSEKAWF